MPFQREHSSEHHRDTGQSAVEFALVLPVLLLVLLGALDLGRAFYYQVIIADAAREGVRAGSVYTKSDGEIRSAAKNEVSSAIFLPDSNIAIDPPSVRASGQPVTVTVSYDFAALTPVIGRMMGSQPIRMARSAVAVVQ